MGICSRHSRESGNLEFQCGKNLSEKPKFKDLDSRLRRNDGVLSCRFGLLFFVEMTRLWIARIYPFRRHSHKSGNLEMKSNRNLSE
ncbi:hypothetical protein NEILACOT_05294, partial [Neisseria lactamica ATCC 23970]